MIARFLSVTCLVLLGGCASSLPGPPQIQTVPVDRPIPVSCVPAGSPDQPAYQDTDAALKAAPDFAIRDALLKSERPKHQAREAYLEALRTTCMKAGILGTVPPQ